jgi:hypothetical protein
VDAAKELTLDVDTGPVEAEGAEAPAKSRKGTNAEQPAA